MTYKRKRLAHAKHNRSASNFLDKHTGRNDWVLTTAFYSCIHFILHKSFPLTIGGDRYNNFEEYYIKYSKPKFEEGKHQSTIRLSADIPKIHGGFSWLHSACISARYSNYQVKDRKKDKARKIMQKIETACK